MSEDSVNSTSLRGRILIADDDEMLRDSLSAQLQQESYHCVCADSGDAALALLGKESFDALIADIQMPGNAGLELVEAIPQVAAGLPIILLTGNPTIETAAKSVRLPVYAYLVKPPVKAELLTLLAQGIVQYRQRRTVHDSRQRLRDLDVALEQLENNFNKASGPSGDHQMSGFLRLTLRNIVASLIDLERASSLLQENQEKGAFFQKAELVTALRYTVDILEKTRQNFKSKELGQLRQQLEWLLHQQRS